MGGALTSTCKRREDHSLHTSDSNRGLLKSKKSRLFHKPDRPMSSNSLVRMMKQYPVAMAPLKREVQAPCRPMKKQAGNRSIWIPCWHCFDWVAPPKTAKKGKEVIIVDSEEDVRAEYFEHPGLEEITTVSHQRSISNNVDEINLEESDEKALVSDQRSIDSEELDEKVQVDPRSSVSSRSNVEELNSETSYPTNLEIIENHMSSLSLNSDVGFDAVSEQKTLMMGAKRVGSDLSSLKSASDLDEKQLPDPENKPEKDIPQEAFVPLTKKEKNAVFRALSPENRRRVLATHHNSNVEITGEILQCLRPMAWLNDEVINVYMELLKEREIRDPEKFLKCHFFNTFFYKKMISGANGYDFKSVRRWTTPRKLGYNLVDCDKIFIPVHKEVHWCLAVINKKEEKFQYLDSLGGIDFEVFGNLARYFVDEVRDKSGKDIDVSSWQQEYVEDLPQQKNGSDCGMFMIKYTDFYSRGGGLYFDQGDMNYFRLRTAKEILRLKAD